MASDFISIMATTNTEIKPISLSNRGNEDFRGD